MVDGRSKSFPFLGFRSVGSYTIAETLQDLRKDPNVGAVVIRVESGGGSAGGGRTSSGAKSSSLPPRSPS